jgi:transcriptional regulator with XRE-family HTH domain
MINVEEIKEKVSEAIKYSGRTQTEIAKAIGVSQAMISDYLRKRKTPQIETLANLCQFLDLDANDILCIQPTHNTNLSI